MENKDKILDSLEKINRTVNDLIVAINITSDRTTLLENRIIKLEENNNLKTK